MATTKMSNLSTIKTLIQFAHDEMHNRHALNKADFEKYGATEQDLDQWCAYCEDLRLAASEYNKVAQDINADSKTIQKAVGAVWAEWRRVLKAGTEGDFNKNFFVRKEDAHLIGEWAALAAISTAKGKVWGCNTATNFRKNVETAIGIRMAGNAMLDDASRDIITSYEGAVKAIKKNTELLDDTENKKGETIEGLRSRLKKATAHYNAQKAFLDQLGDNVTQDQKDGFLKAADNAIKAVKEEIKAAEKALKEAKKVKAETEKEYKKAIALIKSVGDYR